MRPLVLCNACKRHVKISETQCPFCSAAVAVPRRSSAQSPRGLPGGRAALFLTGAALAAAGCADEHEPDGLDDDTDLVSDASTQHAPKDAGIAATDAGRDAGRDAGLIAQPYGISIPLDASIRPPKDAGPSCPQVGNLPAPVYGISIDAPPIDQCSDAGQDAGQDAGKDAGADAGKDAGADAGKDSGFIAVPPYGIAVPVYGVAIDPDR
jgi:hypothetical protein